MSRGKTCHACRQSVREKSVREDQSLNGVRIIVHRFKNGSTVVEADCQCFGHTFRSHSSVRCVLLQRLHTREGS
jgi:hypothetical protein